MQTRSPSFVECLESRRMFSANANIVGEFTGAVTHGSSSFSTALTVTSESRRGVIVGTIAIRFSKHDTPVYSYTGRIVGNAVAISIPTHNTSLNASVNTRRHTMTGTGTANGQSGTFSLKFVS